MPSSIYRHFNNQNEPDKSSPGFRAGSLMRYFAEVNDWHKRTGRKDLPQRVDDHLMRESFGAPTSAIKQKAMEKVGK